MINIWITTDHTYRQTQSFELARNLSDNIKLYLGDDGKTLPKEQRPDIVIGCGEFVAENTLFIKEKYGAMAVSVLDPRTHHNDFDYIIVPDHEPHINGKNVFTSTGLINHISKEIIDASYYPDNEMSTEVKKLKKPTALIIGGKHVGGNLQDDDMKTLAKICNKQCSSLMISTSKRTNETLLDTLIKHLKIPYVAYYYKKDRMVENPYLYFINMAENVIVTSDSVRMCSELCSSGKNIAIYQSQNIFFGYLAFANKLISDGYATDVNDGFIECRTLNEAQRIASLIQDGFIGNYI